MEFKPPRGLNLESDVSQNWKNFKQKFDIFLEANEYTNKSNAIKIAMLLNCIGDDALALYNTFKLSDIDKTNYDSVIKAFEDYCTPRKSTVFNRFKFFNRSQQESETFDHYQTELKKLSQTCEFGEQQDSLIRDKIIIGIKDKTLQERLLREENLMLVKVIEVCRVFELSKNEAKSLQNVNNVDAISASSSKSDDSSNKSKVFKCTRCNREHGKNQCPAFGQMCHKCGKKNHFKSACKNKSMGISKHSLQKKKYVREIKERNSTSEEELFSVNQVDLNKENNVDEWYHNISINNVPVLFKLDTGADVNVMPYNIYSKLCSDTQLQPTESKIFAYGGAQVKIIGIIKLKCVPENRKEVKLQFYVIDKEAVPILSKSTCIELNLVSRIHLAQLVEKTEDIQNRKQFVEENKDIFNGLGKLPFTYKIRLTEDAVPVVKPARRVPEAIKIKLKSTLEKMEKMNIIAKVTIPTDWVNDMVIVEKKDGSLRICLSPLELNKYIKREIYHIPTVDELTANLAGKKVFTVLDMKDGFFQVCLESSSTFLCTFNTPYGRYKFNRLPFGLCSSPEVFQRENVKIFGDIEGVQIYFDDIIVAADNEQEHEEILNKVIKKARECNVKFNAQKLQYKVNQVNYLGFDFSKEGFKPSEKHIASIKELSEPKNKKSLQKFLGVITYLHKFIPHMSNITAPLRKLLKLNVPWEWKSEHQKSFQELKTIVCKVPTLKFFDPRQDIVLQSDASKDGLGACLLQNGQPVAFLSRSLTDAEKRYSMVEKELLGVCFATQKFHHFIYGHRVTVHTDHKPLVNIIEKDLHKSTNRIQRLLLKLLNYKLKLVYIPGKFMYIADYLSRNFINKRVFDDPDMTDVVHTIMLEDDLPISKGRLKMLQLETKNDTVLKQVTENVHNGWIDKAKLDSSLKCFYKIRNELHVKQGILFVNNKVCVPESMYSEMLKQIHGDAHVGIVKAKKRARSLLYWPKMSLMIENFIKACKYCEIHQKSNVKEPMLSHEIPKIPFYKIAVDIGEYGAKNYLIAVDFLSKWIEILPIKNKTMCEVISKLKFIFSVHGIPKEIVCDNNPFNSYQFKNLSKELDFDITYISPYHHQSNGLCERAVGIAKSIIKKSTCKEDIFSALLDYRVTPVAGTNYSPSEMLMGRMLRSKLPCTLEILKPKLVIESGYKQLMAKQNKSKLYYNSHSRKRENFEKGNKVVVQNPVDKCWKPGIILEKNNTPRSYKVETEDCKKYTRNSIHLKKSLNSPNFVNDDIVNDILSEPVQNSDQSNIRDSELTCQSTSETDNLVRTRYGRIVKKPVRFNSHNS